MNVVTLKPDIILFFIQKAGKKETVVIDDSDIVILFGYVALQLEGTLAIKWKDEVMS